MVGSVVEIDEPVRKILFLGDEKIGKTTFIKRFCEYMSRYFRYDTYEGNFLIFTQFLWYRNYFGKRFPTRILDLPAGTTEESRRDQYPNQVNLIVLCYAVDNPDSLVSVYQRWIPEFRQYYPNPPRFCLLGLKTDTRLEMIAAGRFPVMEARARQIHRQFEFKGPNLECSVEAKPEHARFCMDVIVNDPLIYDEPEIER